MTASPNTATRARFETERELDAPFMGSYQTIGTALTDIPSIIIFDNQSSVPCEISVDGTNTWKTFDIGEAAVIDFASNNLLVAVGTQFYLNASSTSTGSFFIDIIYSG